MVGIFFGVFYDTGGSWISALLASGIYAFIAYWISWFFVRDKKNKRFKGIIKKWDPERLHKINRDNAYSKKIKNPKNTYYSQEINKLGMKDKKGKNVKVWRLVKSSYDEMNDLYIPIYPKRKNHKKNI